MDTEREQICRILAAHGLSDTGLVKADAGFRNTVWLTDTAAVKIYGKDNGYGAAIERWIYREVRPSYAPELLGEGEDYIILRRIHGESLFHLWYQTDEKTRRQYIRHNTPGRNWDCLYTWDSGFIGMGLGCGDFERAYECLNTYLTPVGDIHSPFVFHGSVVPTQIFLYQYLFDKYPVFAQWNTDMFLYMYFR